MEMPTPTTTSVLNYDVSTNGFTFRKRQERVDWKKLASIDIEKLSHNLDFHCLQDNIVHITFCDIEHEVDRNSVDPNYIKLYKLAQMIIEYLLHSQEYLANIIQNLEEKLKQSLDNLEEEKIARSKDQKLINDLRKECKKRKRQLAAQQQYFESLNKQYFKCSHCPKTFIGPSFLKSHILRRHPEFAEKISNYDDDDDDDVKYKENTNALIALGKQLEDIKEKFKNSVGTSVEENIINRNKIVEERADKENDTLLKSIEEWKKDEMNKHSAELEAVRNTFMKELKEIQKKHQKSEIALKELQEKYAEVTQSCLEKTNQPSSALEREQDVEALKEQFKSQLTFVESDLQKYLKKQEKEWQMKMDKQLCEYNSEIEKLNIALKESIKQIKSEQEKKAFNEKYYEKQIQKLMDDSKKQDYLIQEQEKKLKEISLMQNQLQIPNESPPLPPPRTYLVNKASQSLPKKSQVDKQDYNLTNYRVKAVLKSNPGLLNGLHVEFCGFLEDKLQSYGINPVVKTVNNKLFHKGIEFIKKDQDFLMKKYEKFSDIRNYCENVVNKMASDSKHSLERKSKLMKRSPDQESSGKKNAISIQSAILKSKNISTSKKQKSIEDSFDLSPSKFYHPITSSSPKLYSSVSNSHNSSPKSVPSKLTESIEYSNTFKSPSLQHSFDKSQIPEEDSSNTESNEDENSEIFKDKLKTFQEVRPVPIPRKLTEPKRVSFEDEKSSSEVTESSESYVESSNSSGLEEDMELSQYQPIRVKPPSGERVTKLTQSIENQLMGRQTKPPPGAIDVTPIAGVVTNQLVLEKTSNKSDDDDFSLSSIENELKITEIEKQNYKSENVTKKLHSDINSAWSTSTNDKSESQEKSSIKKVLSSWDSDDDISIEEIQ